MAQGRSVSGYLLDTNIVSDAMKPSPSPTLLAWLRERDDSELFISSITIAEIFRGILEKPAGRKRASLEEWFASPRGPQALFERRILPFDERAALARAVSALFSSLFWRSAWLPALSRAWRSSKSSRPLASGA